MEHIKDKVISDLYERCQLRKREGSIMKRSVSMGMGIAVMPLKAVEEEAKRGKLLMFHLDPGKAGRTLYLAFRKEDEEQTMILDFTALCRKYNGRERL